MVPDNLYASRASRQDREQRAQGVRAPTILADEAINNVTEALRSSGAYDNAVIIIVSDNGGNRTEGLGSNYGAA